MHASTMMNTSKLTLAACALAALGACGGSDEATTRVVNLDFATVAGSSLVQCGDTITNMGTTNTNATMKDARFYVSNIYLVRPNGTEERFIPNASTDEEKKWNHVDGANSVSLIDLENATSGCASEEKTSAETNTRISATVPNDLYTGVRFEVGVPFALNHTNTIASDTPQPLQSQSMAWSWLGGRKFIKVEVGPAANTTWAKTQMNFHLGSTGCSGTNSGVTAGAFCDEPNRMMVPLSNLNPDTHKIGLDIHALFAGIDLARDAGGASGCMSAKDDPECVATFDAVQVGLGAKNGLPINGGTAQRVFKAVAK